MPILDLTANRLGIYFFYDKDGIVDRYVTCFLEDFSKNTSELIIVCNGILTEDGREKFSKFTQNIIVRENTGFDFWAYKQALDFYGWDTLSSFSEVVVANSTMMGPIYPFSVMFDEMSKRDLDFWGITKHYEILSNPFGCNPYGYIPEHLQSNFLAFRSSFIKSQEFQDFWNDLPEANSYEEAIGKHETFFTKHFADLGYKWDSYVYTDDLKELNAYLLMHYPTKLIRERHCPIFKRRTFFHNYDYLLANTTGQSALDLYRYLNEHTNYDFDLVWENIIRTCHQSDFVRNLHLNFTLPTNNCHETEINEVLKIKRVALVMHLYFEDLIDNSFQYASAMPALADVYITTDTPQKKAAIEKKFAELYCNHLEVRIIENRGRDVSSILVGVKDIVDRYEYICFVHDKKTAQINPGSVGESFGYKCLENMLHNETYVYNIIETFENNPRLGLLSPPEPNHSIFYCTIGLEWGLNYENVKKLAGELGITVPISEDKPPIAPLGTMFWFRTAAFKCLYEPNWEYSDFPPEPNANDGTILHAIERIYPFAVQQEGYYPALVMADSFARIEYTNLHYYSRSLNLELFNMSIFGTQYDMRQKVICKQRLLEELSQKELLYNYETERLTAEINRLIPLTSLKRQIIIRIKSALPKPLRKTALKIKRRLFGPHGILYERLED